jgi:hypothetical protein
MLRFSSAPILLVFLTSTPLVACSSDNSGPPAGGTITVDNEESFALTDLYIDDVGNDTFSDNLLGNVPLQMGETIVVDLPCSNYDVEIIDEAGGDCKVFNTDPCGPTGATFTINDAFCTFSQFRDGKLEPQFKVPRVMPGQPTPTDATITK